MTFIPLPIIIMYALLIPCVALFLFNAYRAEGKPAAATVFKGISTWIIVCAALVGSLSMFGQSSLFSVLIIAGLVMGLSGDVALRFSGQGFISGMVFFALGHLCYIAAMVITSGFVLFSIPVFVLLYAVVFVIILRNRVNLREMFIPSIIYGAVITCMLSLTVTMPLSVFPNGLILLFACILFVVSDALLAKTTFTLAYNWPVFHLSPNERCPVSLCCYFAGQSLFAVSVYYIVGTIA